MAKDNEPARLLLPYLQRADELQKHEPLVAYYCRLYAMDRGLKIPQNERTKYTNSLLISIMNQLEKDKKSLKLGPDDNLHLEGFASSVFEKADKQDRTGRADLNTAKTFYAASIFFEILNQFGEVQPDLEQKQKYAVWKAADIRKALKEGRKPEPGPPGGDKDPSILSSTPSNDYDLELRQIDSGTNPAPEPDPSPQFYDEVSPQHSTSIPPQHSTNVPASPHVPASPSYPTAGYFSHDFHPPTTNISENSSYFSHDFHPPPKTNLSENSTYSQPFNHEIHPQEPQLHSAQNYTSHEIPSYSYPSFQSYPSFTDSSLPPAPSHYPSYSQDSNSSYPTQSVPSKSDYSQTTLYHSGSINGTVSDVVPPAPAYKYDSNYQPTPEKVAEAHKAARFAVGALAFDDVSVAVDYLKKSLELLTNPSAGQ